MQDSGQPESLKAWYSVKGARSGCSLYQLHDITEIISLFTWSCKAWSDAVQVEHFISREKTMRAHIDEVDRNSMYMYQQMKVMYSNMQAALAVKGQLQRQVQQLRVIKGVRKRLITAC